MKEVSKLLFGQKLEQRRPVWTGLTHLKSLQGPEPGNKRISNPGRGSPPPEQVIDKRWHILKQRSILVTVYNKHQAFLAQW
jgi:hypothetical protein